MHGCMDAWVCGCKGAWLYCTDAWVHRCLGVWVHGVRVHGCFGVWVYRCVGVWAYRCGCMGAYVYGRMGVCIGVLVLFGLAGLNQIGPAGMEHLSTALTVNKTLTSLTIGGTCLSLCVRVDIMCGAMYEMVGCWRGIGVDGLLRAWNERGWVYGWGVC